MDCLAMWDIGSCVAMKMLPAEHTASKSSCVFEQRGGSMTRIELGGMSRSSCKYLTQIQVFAVIMVMICCFHPDTEQLP